MHPAIILVPVAAMLFGPRLWVMRVMKTHDHEDEDQFDSAAESARRWLDAHQLQLVKVEITDLGDHYDPQAKAVRLNRNRFDRKSLTAVTAAAHEVSHALQDAQDYPPFVWRKRLAELVQIVGQVGTVILLSVPAAALLTRRPIPPVLVGTTLLVMLGGGAVLQIVALQTELDASFKKAFPLLRDSTVDTDQLKEARQILTACSLTYLASSVLSVLNIWPWLNGMAASAGQGVFLLEKPIQNDAQRVGSVHQKAGQPKRKITYQRSTQGTAHRLVRGVGKPLVRAWFRLKYQLT